MVVLPYIYKIWQPLHYIGIRHISQMQVRLLPDTVRLLVGHMETGISFRILKIGLEG